WASFFRASNSSAKIESSVWMRHTRRCSFTEIRAFSMSVVGLTCLPHLTQNVGAIHDGIAIALLGQKKLPVVGKVKFAGVARDQRVKVGDLAARLGPKYPSQALRLFLPRAEGPGHLDEHVGVGKVQGEIAHLGEDQLADLAAAK